MKKILLVFSAAVMIASCNKQDYTVTGTVKGMENGKTAILETQDSLGQLKSVDTVKIENGKFTFKGKAKEPQMYLVQLENAQGKIAFILENGNIEITANKDSLNLAKVSGTYNNDQLTEFKAAGMGIQKKMMKFQEENMAKMNQAQQTQDTVVMNSLRKEFGKFQEEFVKQSEDYVKGHPKAYISALIVEGMFNQMSPDVAKITTYYDGLDKSVQDTEAGKTIKKKLAQLKNPAAQAPPMPQQAPAPTPAPGEGDSK